jgi:hypothetical protein
MSNRKSKMQYKYKMEIMDSNGNVEVMRMYVRKSAIAKDYNIPNYIVDKIIKITNNCDPNFVQKRETQLYYREIVKTMKIYLVKQPSINQMQPIKEVPEEEVSLNPEEQTVSFVW